MLRDLLPSTDSDLTIPDVLGGRCVHSLIEVASCRACVEACPQGAWVIDEEMLGIDANRCDGCDLCVPACPEEAIVPRFRAAVRDTPRGKIAMACCEQAPVSGERLPRMPCLHAISVPTLLGLARDDVRYLITTCGDCDHCPRGARERLWDRLTPINGLLESRGRDGIVHRPTDAPTWQATWQQVSSTASQAPVDRRGFFRRAITEPVKRAEEAMARADEHFLPPGLLLPRPSADAPGPWAPRIDPGRCSGCDACTRVCPHAALGLDRTDPAAPAYRIDPDRCTGCGICSDVCDEDAIEVIRWGSVSRPRIPLVSGRCRACGVSFHRPQPPPDHQQPPGQALCRICARTNHYKNLYQVLD